MAYTETNTLSSHMGPIDGREMINDVTYGMLFQLTTWVHF